MCLVSWWFMDMFSLVVYGYMCFAVVYANMFSFVVVYGYL